jgi:hypothetical protein
VLVALAIGIPLIARANGRRAWREDLTAAEADVAWFSRVLVPSLRQSASLDQVAGAWAVSAERVQALENKLGKLTTSPPDDDARARVTRLHDVVVRSREQIQHLLTSGSADAIPRVMGVVSSELETALSSPAASHR